MPKSSEAKLKYMAEYQKSPEEVKKREARNRARYAELKKGTVHVGDKKEVDHKKMLDKGGSGTPGNTRVVSEAENAGWRKKNPGAYTKK